MYPEGPSHLPKTLPYFLAEEIRRRIIEGEYQPGQPLREQELESKFGSSRGPIREAFRLLLQSGLVEHQPRKGFRVKKYSPKALEDLYRLRAMLEGAVIDELAGVEIPPLVQALRRILDDMEKSYSDNDLKKYFSVNVQFHQKIIDSTENEPLRNVLQYVNEMSLPVRHLLLQKNFPSRRTIDYHRQIVDSIEKGDLATARRVTEEHILSNLAAVKEAYPETTGAEADG